MIITIANHKGGTGKTTIATHLATFLAKQGHWTLLVDLDTQGNVAHFVGLPPKNDLAQLIQAVVILPPARRPSPREFLSGVAGYQDLAVIRGWKDSAELEADLRRPNVTTPAAVLREALTPFLHSTRIIAVLDTGPYAGKLQEAAIGIADCLFVPGAPEFATESGILDIAAQLQALGRTITGVIPTLYNARAHEHMSTIRDWQKALGPIVYYEPRQGLVGLPRRVIWGEIVRRGRPIWDVAPWDQAAREMEAVLRRMIYDAKIE